MQIDIGLKVVHIYDGLLSVYSLMNGVSRRFGIRRKDFCRSTCWRQQHYRLLQL